MDYPLLQSYLVLFVGVLVANFTLVQCLMILRVGLPLTKDFVNLELLSRENAKQIRANYTRSLLLLSLIFIVVSAVICYFCTQVWHFYFIGVAFVLVVRWFKTGREATNVSKYYYYLEQNHFTDDEGKIKAAIDQMVEELQRKEDGLSDNKRDDAADEEVTMSIEAPQSSGLEEEAASSGSTEADENSEEKQNPAKV